MNLIEVLKQDPTRVRRKSWPADVSWDIADDGPVKYLATQSPNIEALLADDWEVWKYPEYFVVPERCISGDVRPFLAHASTIIVNGITFQKL